MKVRIVKPNRIEKCRAGEIVEVSPARAAFLFEVNLAEPAPIREQIEVPEKKTAAKKTTRTKK